MMDNPLYVAIDKMDLYKARTLAESLRGQIGGFKIGLTFWLRHGGYTATRYVTDGFDWFLDLKFHDIPDQVDGALRAVVPHQPRMISIHQQGGEAMMEAAMVAAKEESVIQKVRRPLILAVTMLTSLPARSQEVVNRALCAQAMGVDGVICSAREARFLRKALRSDMIILTPGIRLPESPQDDQQRIATPQQAIESGANYIIVGRPITQAVDPAQAAKNILASIHMMN